MGLFTYKTYVPHHRETSSSTRVSHHLFKWIKNIDDIFDVWHTIKRILSTITKRREKPETLFGQQETHPQIRPRSLDIRMRRVGGPHCGASYNTFPFPIVKMRKRQLQNKRKSGKNSPVWKTGSGDVWMSVRSYSCCVILTTTKANDNTHYCHQMFDDVLKDLCMELLHP